MIKIENISKFFGKLQVLKNVNVHFQKGQTVAIIGPNGSGKTTLIKILLGMVVPTKGAVYFDGESINNQCAYRSKIGYMPQIGAYPANLKTYQLFDMMIDLRGGQALKELDNDLIEAFQLENIFQKALGTLSGGTKQKVSAALAFLFNPKVLILDEPTAGLDPLSSEILKEKIQKEHEKGKLILITSHIMADLDELATDILYMQDTEVKFNKSLEQLKLETGEAKLNKIIAQIMSVEKKSKKYSLEVII